MKSVVEESGLIASGPCLSMYELWPCYLHPEVKRWYRRRPCVIVFVEGHTCPRYIGHVNGNILLRLMLELYIY